MIKCLPQLKCCKTMEYWVAILSVIVMSVMVIWKSLHEREIKKEMIYTIGAVPSARVKSIEACWLTLEPTANKSAAMWYFRKK